MKIVELLDSYTEVSPSGRGLHVWVRGKVPGDRRRRGKLEMYDSAAAGTAGIVDVVLLVYYWNLLTALGTPVG